MAEYDLQIAKNAAAEALKSVKTASALVDEYMVKIQKIEEEIEVIEDSADFTTNESRYIILKQRQEEVKQKFSEANEILKEGDDRLRFYFQLLGDLSSTPNQALERKRTRAGDLKKIIAAPSSFAKSRGEGCWRDVLKKLGGQVDCHRIPFGSDTLPITLMHSVFGEFVQNCHSGIPKSDSCEFAEALSRTMLEDYQSETEMALAARGLLEKYLKVGVGSVSDGSCYINGQLILNLEVQTQPGEGCDSSIQNLAYYIKQLPILVSRQLPCLLVDISGPVVGIYGAMNTDGYDIICEPLCPILPLHDVDNTLINSLLYRACAALRIAVDSLTHLANNSRPDELSSFPYKTCVEIDGTPVTFRYLKRITRYVFLVEYSGADGTHCIAIAKFANKYGREVHEYCAKSGFAPKLLAFEEIPCWNFVLMEYIEMEPISTMDCSVTKQQLCSILNSLQSANFVHGDLRRTNVFWNRDKKRVILIDFDWSGRNREERYPSGMNPEIAWPQGASTGEFLLFEHDAFWVRQLTGDVN